MIGSHPNELPEYRKLRAELLEAEVALRDQRERVAELRRALPRDTVVLDETLARVRDGRVQEVSLSELFADPEKPLVLMHFMYGKAQERPCPMCTAWADGYDGIQRHLRQRVNFAVLVAGDVSAFEAYGRERGWRNLELVSAADSGLKAALGFEDESGAQHPGVSVFLRRGDGALVHTYSVSAWLGEAGFRGMDLLSPIWHYLDLIPEGRGGFMPGKSY